MFKYMRDTLTGNQSTTLIQYTDPEDGSVWTVPEGNRIWSDTYLPWVSAGNTPDPMDETAAV